MIKLNIHPIVLTKAIENAGWTKSVGINPDGSLDWFWETDYPTDDEIYDQVDLLISDWDHVIMPFEGPDTIDQVVYAEGSQESTIETIKNPALTEYEELVSKAKLYMESRNV